MTVETARKEDLFAALQTRLIGAGVKPLSVDMAGIQTKVQEFAKAWADEAVAAATLCVTEEDISEAVAKWAKELQSAGNMVDASKLMAAANVLVEVGERCAEGRAVAVVNLPPEASELPAHLEKRISEVMTIAFPLRREREAMVRLVRALVRDLAGKPRREQEPPVVDRDLHEWLAAYAARIKLPFHSEAEAMSIATEVTEYIRSGHTCTGAVLEQMAKERHLKDPQALTSYIRRLPRDDAPAMVPQPVQQPQGHPIGAGFRDDADERARMARIRAQTAQAEAQARQMQPGASVAGPTYMDRRAAVDGLARALHNVQSPVRHLEQYGRRSAGHAVIAAAAFFRHMGAPTLSSVLLTRTDTVAALQIEAAADVVLDPEALEPVAEAAAKAKGWSRGTVAIDGGKVIAGAMLLDAYGRLEQFRECRTWLELCSDLCIPVLTPDNRKEAMPNDHAHEGEDVARPRQDGGSAAAAGGDAEAPAETVGDAQTLDAFCRRTGKTPSMMEADRDIWRTRAQRAEFVLTAIHNVMSIGMPSAAPLDRVTIRSDGPVILPSEDAAECAARAHGWDRPAPGGYFVNGRLQRTSLMQTWVDLCMERSIQVAQEASPPFLDIGVEQDCEAAARANGWVCQPGGFFRNIRNGVAVAPSTWRTLCEAQGIKIPQRGQQQQSDHGKGAIAGASYHEIAARAAGWDFGSDTRFINRHAFRDSNALSWESLCNEQGIPAYPPGKDPRGPQFETFSGDKVATIGPDAASAIGRRQTSLLEANGLHRPTWDAAVKACCDWSADRAGTDAEVADVDAMRREVTFPNA